MPQSPKDQEQDHDDKIVSRRDVLKGGAATVASALAALMAARRGSAAVGTLDGPYATRKKGNIVTRNAVTSMD